MNGDAFARNTDPQTSHDAVQRIQKKLTELERGVVHALQVLQTGTATEVGKWIIKHKSELVKDADTFMSSVSPRFAPLERRSYIQKTGDRRDNRNVYELTPETKQRNLF